MFTDNTVNMVPKGQKEQSERSPAKQSLEALEMGHGCPHNQAAVGFSGKKVERCIFSDLFQ